MSRHAIVVVGAGHSGAKAAFALRKHGWSGSIVLVGDETYVPYDRPPLSKAVLLGKKSSDQCAFFPTSWYADNAIDLQLGAAVAGIDRETRHIIFDDARKISYGKLLLATGSSVNPLIVPGRDLHGVFPLRNPGHADAIARALRPGRRLVVIGAGVIGLEVAAAAVTLGCEVTVLEMVPRAMGRSLPEVVSAVVAAEHRARGVDIRFDVRVASLEGQTWVSAVRLETSEVISCDVVVYGVGVTPRTLLAEGAGLRVNNGIQTDRHLRTTDPNIFACGDVCNYESALFDCALRLENWKNAEDQADTVARNMLGHDKVFDEVPWFWSNQYDLTLQVVGLPALGETTIARAIGSSSIFLSFDAQGRLCGASGLGAVRDIAKPIRDLKAAIAERQLVDPTSVGTPVALSASFGPDAKAPAA